MELFNLDEDVGEQHDVANSHPEKSRELLGMLTRWRQELDANMPKPNPDYKPKR